MNQKSDRKNAAERFYSFLSSHSVTIGTMDDRCVSERQLIPDSNNLPKLTKFKALGDIVLYSKLLTEVVKNHIPSDGQVSIVDLGAGSSIPTLNALLSTRTRDRLNIVAVDDDTEAIQVSKQNVEMFGLNDNYSFIVADMLSFLSRSNPSANYILASNPPFLPVPPGTTDSFFGPVDGGADGTKYLEPLLLWPMSQGSVVAVRWCSLGNPCKIIDLIEENYEVLHLSAHGTVFGPYTSSCHLLHYIEKNRDSSTCLFEADDTGEYKYTSVECILKRR